ncbi:MAG: hypothetical protein HY002_19305 [Candidatus Rokubacteria bacterium]|nr:hypothetical protein [Candidatus Rokubacteria bacterium]
MDVGRHALSSVARELRHGSLELQHPLVKDRVERALRRSIDLVPAAEAVVAEVRPDLALFLERGYTPYGEIFDVLLNAGVDTIQWFHGHRSDALAFKRYTRETRDLHGFSLSPSTWERVRAMPWTEGRDREVLRELRERYESGTWFARKFANVGKRLKTPEEVRRQLGLDPAKKTAVIFSHILWDATFFFGENLFEDYEEWLVETVKAACANAAVNWVVKLHPDYVWKLKLDDAGWEIRDEIAIRAKVGALPGHVRLLPPDTDINTFSLFPVTDYCLTVRGTIGIEMPCFGIPVLTAGTGRYSGLGFTIDSKSREEYLERLGRIQEIPRLGEEETRLARKHAYTLLKLRLCPLITFEFVQTPLETLGHPLAHDVSIRARSGRDIETAADLTAFVHWAIESREPDFLLSLDGRGEPAAGPWGPAVGGGESAGGGGARG